MGDDEAGDNVALDDTYGRAGPGPGTTPMPVSLALLVLVALGIGIFSDRGAMLSAPWGALAETGTPWVLLAFAAGRQRARPLLGGMRGALVVLAGLAGYYGWLMLVEGVAWGTVTHQYRPTAWLVAGLGVGTAFGVLGSLATTSGSRPVGLAAWAAVVSVPVAESVRMFRQPPTVGPGTSIVLVLTAALLVLVSRRDGVHPAALLIVAALLGTALVPVAWSFRQLI